MQRKVVAIICLMGLWGVLYPNSVVEAATNVKDCIENADCNEADTAPADTTENDEERDAADSPGTGSLLMNIVKMIFALLLVLGLIYLLLKFLHNRNKRFQQVKGLENMGGVSVGPNKSVQVVRIGSKVFLIGVGENVQLLEEITDDETKKELVHNDHSDDHQAAGGLAALFQSKNTEKNAGDGNDDFKRLFSTELEKLKQTRRSLLHQSTQKDDRHE
ncbi:flagellar biosynthetic protein FliO [Lentibacillus salinarum]|uniref:Flagellar biosynthetic protein FliO n=1 Tax=Lentibacillus salinarum TaxID=446820 RepID=A0ABW3ZQQ9_9BACI